MRIRVLRGGVTIGSRSYNAGEELEAEHMTANSHEWAAGKRLLFGERIMEYVSSASKEEPSAPPESQAAESEHKPEQEADNEAPALEQAILDLVVAGQAKGHIVKTLAEGPEYSQRQVIAEFDRLVNTGRIVPGETRGTYSVTEA